MAFVFEGLLGATITLSLLYMMLMLYIGRKLLWLQSNSSSGLNTKKLFVMTCLLTAALRFMSFGSMALLDLGKVGFHMPSSGNVLEKDDDHGPGNQAFFEKATLVLFDFPDFCCISAYVLLLVIWAEAYLKSRRHWLSPIRFRRAWMFGYCIFNVVLYSSQITLYSLLFLPSINQFVETTLIYITLSVFNLALPVLWMAVYVYLAILFSGFPFSTITDRVRLRHLSRLGFVWSMARFGWGFVALTSVLKGWLTEVKRSKIFYSVVLVCIFLVAEFIPIIFSLQEKIIQSLGEKESILQQQRQTTSTSNRSSSNHPSQLRQPQTAMFKPSGSSSVLSLSEYNRDELCEEDELEQQQGQQLLLPQGVNLPPLYSAITPSPISPTQSIAIPNPLYEQHQYHHSQPPRVSEAGSSSLESFYTASPGSPHRLSDPSSPSNNYLHGPARSNSSRPQQQSSPTSSFWRSVLGV